MYIIHYKNETDLRLFLVEGTFLFLGKKGFFNTEF